MVKVRFIGNFWDDLNYLKKRVESNWGNPINYGIELTTEEDYDYQIIINKSKNPNPGPREKNIGITMEPSWSSNYDRNLSDYCFLTLTSSTGLTGDGVSHGLNFMFYEDSQDTSISSYRFRYDFNFKKPKKLSIIVSNWNSQDRNHNYFWRENLVKKILDSDLDIDIFGKNWNISDSRYKGHIKDKIEGLKDYEYSIAIENSCEDYYVSEKLFDCFLNNTVPIYYGCKNAGRYYDPKSFVYFDLKADDVISNIKNIIKEDNYNYKDYVLKSKAWYFTRYNLLHYIQENIIKNNNIS